MTRGFVTIATGNEKYYEMAAQLLRSYRKYSTAASPFAIICDRENRFTQEFDQVILMEQATCSYMDKLLLYRYAPYDETIFIDADSLVMSDPRGLWEDFSDADDVSCYGCVYPLDSDRAWFSYDKCGKYQKDIKFLIDLHGGIYFLRKGERCRSIFEKAIELAQQYTQYGFKNFENPADEPVLAMSLAIHRSRPCDKPMRVLFVPSYWGKLRINSKGELFVAGTKRRIEIIHFGTANTERFIYRYLVALHNSNGSTCATYMRIWMTAAPKEFVVHVRHWVGAVLRHLLPASLVNRLKERI